MIGNDSTSIPIRTNSMGAPGAQISLAGPASKAGPGATHRAARALVGLSPIKVQELEGSGRDRLDSIHNHTVVLSVPYGPSKMGVNVLKLKRSPLGPSAHPQPRRGAFLHHVAAEAE
jgi:hypothetical protein